MNIRWEKVPVRIPTEIEGTHTHVYACDTASNKLTVCIHHYYGHTVDTADEEFASGPVHCADDRLVRPADVDNTMIHAVCYYRNYHT